MSKSRKAMNMETSSVEITRSINNIRRTLSVGTDDGLLGYA
jgi:hypothetical protein